MGKGIKMTGWNLPPGCNVSDIPGNRKIDFLWEREVEKYCENCEEEKCNHDIEICQCAEEFEKYFERMLGLI